MNVQYWQEIVYPCLLLLSFAMASALLLTCILVDRLRLILVLSAYFYLQSVAFALLVLATGRNPIIAIDQYRPYIIYARAAMAILLFVCVVMQTERVLKQR